MIVFRSLADDGLLVVAGDVVPLDAVLVEVVEDGQTVLDAILMVVRLGAASAAGQGRRGCRQSNHLLSK